MIDIFVFYIPFRRGLGMTSDRIDFGIETLEMFVRDTEPLFAGAYLGRVLEAVLQLETAIFHALERRTIQGSLERKRNTSTLKHF